MANPLSRVIMSNIANKSGKVSPNTRNTYDASTSSMHISLDQEDMLLSLMKKRSNSSNNSYRQSSNYNKPSKDTRQNRNIQKLQLEDLVKGKSKPISENKPAKKSNTMMTLDQLAGKVKPKENSSDNVKKSVYDKRETYKNNTSKVRSNVIGNLEAYVPKVSLDSIGKKGSLR